MVRINRLRNIKVREDEGRYGDSALASALLNDVDFIREEVHEPQNRRTQTSLSRSQIFADIHQLQSGIAHYVELGHEQLQDPGSGFKFERCYAAVHCCA